VADRICPKYPLARQAEIRAGIEAGGYWVDWDLRGDNNQLINKTSNHLIF
jgi:hypothetical protein